MNKISLSLAIGDYDHVRDLLSGAVGVEGIQLRVSRLPVEELFYRFVTFREWSVSEMGFGPYLSMLSQGDTSMVAIPVFPSRLFRHSSFYISNASKIDSPGQLAGKTIGVPEWAMTAAIYARGILEHQYGVDLRSISWVQAGVNEPGRVDNMISKLPAGLTYTSVPNKSLNQLLVAGELDAVISARPPAAFLSGDASISRLFADEEEITFWKNCGIFPIMHTIVISRDVYEQNRWIAMNLYKAFDEAKNRSLARFSDITVSHYPMPWLAHDVHRATELMGRDYWPYGIIPNRKTLDALLEYSFEQGVCHRRLSIEELFVSEVQSRSLV